ncbi:DUF488 family protein [Paracoccus sp. M683]|uniref:DUF488 domain-containing protein n=1 Tax=Paracoccus sp. M683 TaxID=2594268 RepID=UPI0021024271|nr:DUF488 domain-containing protein [Paracoccus sp. M683]
MAPFYTVGHSNRSLQEFIDLIASAGIGFVADIRKMPMSRANPQFNQDRLAEALDGRGIGYAHIASLGGLRGKDWQVPFAVNALWRNRSFHHYADYALSPDFRAGLDQVLALGAERSLTVMCAEAVWWRCHRRIVADYLIAGERPVFHIMGVGRVDPAALTPGAVIRPDASIVYPAEAEAPLT